VPPQNLAPTTALANPEAQNAHSTPENPLRKRTRERAPDLIGAEALTRIPTSDGADRPIDTLFCMAWWSEKEEQWKPSGTGRHDTLSGFAGLAEVVAAIIDETNVPTAGLEGHADVAARTARAKGVTSPEAIAHARQCAVMDAAKKQLPLFVPGAFRDNRKKKELCEHVSAYLGDFDCETEETYARAVAILNASGVAWLAYGTPKDGIPKTPDEPTRCVRRRLVIATSRDMTPNESEHMQRALPRLLGLTPDKQSHDPSRGFFVGTVDDRVPFTDGNLNGRAIDVDAVLAAAPVVALKTRTSKPKAANLTATTGERIANGSSAPRESRRCPPDETPETHALTISRTAPPAIQGKGGHTALFNVACDLVVGLGVAPDVAREILWREYNPRCDPPWTEDEWHDFDRKIDEAETRSTRESGYLLASDTGPATVEWAHPVRSITTPLVFARDERGRIAKTVDNALTYFRHVLRGTVRFEENAGRIVCSGLADSLGETLPDGQWTDVHTTRLRAICERAGLSLAKDAVDSAIEAYAAEHAYNVLADFLVQCARQWDGNPRVDNLFATYFGADDTPATRAASRVFMLSLARRGLEPGAKVDTCPVLVGSQGIKKSSGLAALVGAAWFSDSPLPIGDKDAMQNLRGTWLWEFSENESLSRRERNAVKAFLSSSTDKFRASYGRHSIAVPRQTCFAASTNDPETLTDPTGNRRFLPVRVSAVDVAGIERDRVQLLGEAAYRAGATNEQWWTTADEERALDTVRGEHEETDPWETPIARWLENQSLSFALDDVFDDKCSSLGEVFGPVPIRPAYRDKRAQARASAILRRLKCERFRDKKRGSQRDQWLWRRTQVDPRGPGGSHLLPEGVGPTSAAEKMPEKDTGAQVATKSPYEHPAHIPRAG
jgi:hypothetical protein